MNAAEIVRACVMNTRRFRPSTITAEDAAQAGHLAIIEAELSGRVPQDPEHAANYLRQRAAGAMVDQVRTEARAAVVPAAWSDAGDVAPEKPERAAQVRQAVRLFLRQAGKPQRRCFELLADGLTEAEMAAADGVSTQYVNATKQQAVALFNRWI